VGSTRSARKCSSRWRAPQTCPMPAARAVARSSCGACRRRSAGAKPEPVSRAYYGNAATGTTTTPSPTCSIKRISAHLSSDDGTQEGRGATTKTREVTIEMLSRCSASLRNGDLGQSDARRLPISPERRPIAVAAGTGLLPGAPSRQTVEDAQSS
jgi:hypothetical protein